MDNKLIRQIKNIWGKLKVNNVFKKLTKIILYTATVALISYTFLNLNLMFIEEIDVKSEADLQFVNQRQIEKVLIDNIGKRLYNIDLDTQEQKVYESLSFINEVEIEKVFPKTLEVTVQERIPLLTTIQKNDDETSQYMISKDLWVVAKCDNYQKKCDNLPLVNLETGSLDIQIGEKVNSDSLETIKTIETYLLKNDIESSQYYIPDDSTAVVELEDDSRIIFESDDSIDDQLEDFVHTRHTLLLKDKSYKEMDMRYQRPVVRFDKYTVWMTE